MSDTELKKQIVLKLAWPTPQDYSEALQNPQVSFSDPDLIKGEVATDSLGLPRVASGMFASVYKVNGENRTWAVRCFLRNQPETVNRYVMIEDELRKAGLTSTVEFDLQEEGIRIHGSKLPMLKMAWCDGLSLTAWLDLHVNDSHKLKRFLENWQNTISELQNAGIAHGDLQHGNILVEKEKLFLVDYDGMYVPSLAGKESCEIGHRNYQHPGREKTHYGPYLDNFAAALIYFSIKILSIDPKVWRKFAGGDECILFRAEDLKKPVNSEIFFLLEKHTEHEIRESCWILRHLLNQPIEQLPTLDQILRWDRSKLNQLKANLPNIEAPGSGQFHHDSQVAVASQTNAETSNEDELWWLQHSQAASSRASQVNPPPASPASKFNSAVSGYGKFMIGIIAGIMLLSFISGTMQANQIKEQRKQEEARRISLDHGYERSLEYARHAEHTAIAANKDNLNAAEKIYSDLVEQFAGKTTNTIETKLLSRAKQGLNRVRWKKLSVTQQDKQILEAISDTASLLISKGDEAFRAKKYNDAISIYSR